MSSVSLSRFVTAIIAAIFLLSACGGSETVIGQTSASEPVAVDVADGTSEAAATEAPAEDPATPAAAGPTGTVTLSSGESFDLVMRSCDTQATDPNSLLNDDFVDLYGQSVDGEYFFQVLNATSAEAEERPLQVGLTGDPDENGVNPRIDYVNFGTTNDPTMSFVSVDGARVTGQAPLVGKFSPDKVFGETVTATFEINCG